MSEQTQADREAELAAQAHVIAEVARAGAEELPKLGGVTTTEIAPAVRTAEAPPAKTTETKKEGKR